MLRIASCAVASLLFTYPAFAACTRDANGQVTCDNQQGSSRSGNTGSSQTNDRDVTTTQTNRGGEAKTKNGKGVVTTPGGKNCYKTANRQGCQ
jgi:hypothetical protein